MKIAQIAPAFSPYSVNRLVGIKRIIYILSTELTKRGHQVSIIAPSDSDMSTGNILPTVPSLKSLGLSVYDPKSYSHSLEHAAKAAEYCRDFDLVHSHAEHVFLPFIEKLGVPVVSTIHGTMFSEAEKEIFQKYYGKFYAVGISKTSMKYTDYIKYSSQIYNGVDLNDYAFNADADDYMFYMARINPQKGTTEAIEVAKLTGKKLLVRGYKEISKEDYYNQVLKSSSELDNVDFDKNEVFDLDTKKRFFSHAKLFLFPVMYEETFASTTIESMANGTPVVAYARGSLVEQVEDGKTGYLVNPADSDIRGDFVVKKTGLEGLKEAVDRIYSLSPAEYNEMRANCRKRVENKFTIQKMVDQYEAVYREVKQNFHK